METQELNFGDFLQQFKASSKDVIDVALKSGITDEDIRKIAEHEYHNHPKISAKRVMTKIASAINDEISMRSATSISGCIIGSRDRVGEKKPPVRYLVLKTDGKHKEVSNFGNKTRFGTIDEYVIPMPSLSNVRARFDAQYNSWNLVGIESVQKENLSDVDLTKILSKVVTPSKNITREMAWSKGNPATPVVISGEMLRIFPEAASWKEREDGGKEINTYYNIYTQNEAGIYNVCFNFGLRGGGGKFIKCHIEQQRYGKPTIMVEDLANMCREAVTEFPDDPKAQCAKIDKWFTGTKVFVAGTVGSFRDTASKDGTATTNIDIGVFAVVEMPIERVDGDAGQTMLSSKEKPQRQTENKPLIQTPQQQISIIDDVVADLSAFCEAADVSPDKLTLDVIRSRALDRFEDIPEGVLVSAIERVNAGKKK